MRNCILASTSTIYGQRFLEYLYQPLRTLFRESQKILFVPYARPGGISHEVYTERTAAFFKTLNKSVSGLHTYVSIEEALSETDGIYIGGGNTFVLLKQLQDTNALEPLRKSIHEGIPYLGTSAGSNVAGVTVHTTNDMPVTHPSSLKAMGIIPYNLNCHFVDKDITSTHMGETREERIIEYFAYNSVPVIGLYEGSWLQINDQKIQLHGSLGAKLFSPNTPPLQLEDKSIL